MTRIHQLPPGVITKIAAGEVIERPASVVKELLENAIDAGSTRIDVAVEQGGTDLIRVVDDGHGIHPEDLALAFSSHATSKLHDADDLFKIGTLGFRGEALASIGGVAQVTLQSRAAGQTDGCELICDGGKLSEPRPWSGAPGTRIEVRKLFFNTPVRRKFLRAAATEMGHVSEAFTRLALAHPGLHLRLIHNGKTVYDVMGARATLTGEALRERIGIFFGKELRDKLYPVEMARGPISLRGFAADPTCDRGNARMQYLFVNGRFIRDRNLAHAVQEAYRGLLMTGRYGVVFLFLEMPPDEVDVNVHPTKIEVRFQNAQQMHHLVFSALRERFNRENLVPRMQAPTFDPVPFALRPPEAPAPVFQFALPPAGTRPGAGSASEPSFLGSQQRTEVDTMAVTAPAAEMQVREGQGAAEIAAAVVDASPGAGPPAPSYSKILQVYDTYIILETAEGMLVIDQHALHERILFEQFKGRLRDGPLESQRLLIPEPVELTTEQAAKLLENREELLSLGIGIEPFGGATVLLTAHPTVLSRRSPREVLCSIVDHLMTQDRLPTRDVLLNELLSLMACHAAVRSGDRLTQEEMSVLLEQRQHAYDTHHCPHGRPTALLFSRQELDRQFRRI